MKKKAVLSFLALLPLLSLPRRADGALSCTFQSVSGVNFGSYDVFSASPARATGTIGYSCRKVGGVQFMVMSLSKGSSGTFANRTLRSVTDALNYNLYPDAANKQIWGDGTGSTYRYQIDPVDKQLDILTIYGTIPPGQDVGAGTYVDTITVTMDF